jgi:hypothetical protein
MWNPETLVVLNARREDRERLEASENEAEFEQAVVLNEQDKD